MRQLLSWLFGAGGALYAYNMATDDHPQRRGRVYDPLSSLRLDQIVLLRPTWAARGQGTGTGMPRSASTSGQPPATPRVGLGSPRVGLGSAWGHLGSPEVATGRPRVTWGHLGSACGGMGSPRVVYGRPESAPGLHLSI